MKKIVRKIKAFLVNEEGLSFVEVITVVFIIALISGSAGFIASRYMADARVSRAKNDIQMLDMALNTYYLDNGFYPSEQQGLSALFEKPSGSPEPTKWKGPYLNRQILKDPWGTEYVYRNPGEGNREYGIASYGADKSEGGDGEKADIKSWEEWQ
ncbi:MAG: type II secretion system major pseudopilin GspG [Spirochaetales bacterium]|nr:type II secretion system major pseudopilin GspG [Spirochaetales bacterium]